MWWKPIYTVFDGTATGSITREIMEDFDIRVARRMQNQDEISLVLNNQVASTATYLFNFQCRYLVKT